MTTIQTSRNSPVSEPVQYLEMRRYRSGSCVFRGDLSQRFAAGIVRVLDVLQEKSTKKDAKDAIKMRAERY